MGLKPEAASPSYCLPRTRGKDGWRHGVGLRSRPDKLGGYCVVAQGLLSVRLAGTSGVRLLVPLISLSDACSIPRIVTRVR